MDLHYFIDDLTLYTNKILNKEGWGLIVEAVADENNIKIQLRKSVLQQAKSKFIGLSYGYSIPVFDEFIKELNLINSLVDSEDELSNSKNKRAAYVVSDYKFRILKLLPEFFNREINLLNFYHIVQSTNFAHINTVKILNFFSIKEINLSEINGNKEVYLLGENGDGKSLVLMAIHLAYNGREISNTTKSEFTGIITDILNANKNTQFKATDTNGTTYGSDKGYYLPAFYAYGAHRGRYSTDSFERYGYMTLYNNDLELYHPLELFQQSFLTELSRVTKINFKPIINIKPQVLKELFEELLEDNVKIEISANEVTFTEKGYQTKFHQ